MARVGVTHSASRASGRSRVSPAVFLLASAALVLASQAGAGSSAPTAAATFLSETLGQRLGERPSSQVAVAADVRIRGAGYTVTHAGDAVSVASEDVSRTRWQWFARGSSRTQAFGAETIVVGAGTTEEFLTVVRPQGFRTWRWSLRTGRLTPRLRADGGVAFYEPDGSLSPLSLAPAAILDASGATVTPPGLSWELEPRGAGWRLLLAFDDAELPLPYVIDPAISVDTTASSSGAAVTSLSWSHTVGSQANRMLVVGVTAEDGASACQAASVSYGGQALTKIDEAVAGTSIYQCASLWYLVAPASGTATVSVSFAATMDAATAGAMSLSNVKQAAPDAANSSSSDTGATSTSVTTIAGDSVVVDVFGTGQPLGNLAADSGQTARWTNEAASTASGGGSTKTVTSPSSTSLTWTQTGINRSAHVVAAFQPIDNTSPPAFSIDSPSAGATISNGQAVSANPTDPGSGVASVEFRYCAGTSCAFGSGTSIGTDTSSPYSVSWTGQPTNGTYTLVARATDAFGNATDSSTTTVTVNNSPAPGTGSSTNGGSVSSLSWSHTVGSESNQILVVGVTAERQTAGSCQASSVSYGGQALTKIGEATAGSSVPQCASLWYRVAPATGTATVTVDFSATMTGATAGAVSLSNVEQAAPDASNTSSSDTGATSTSVTTLAADSLVVDVFGTGQALGNLAPGAGQTARWTNEAASTTSGGGSTKTVTSPGSTSLTWTQTGINRSAHVVAAFAPSVPDTTPPTAFALDSPASGATVTNGQVVSASPTDADSAIASVEFRYCAGSTCTFAGGTAIAVDTSSPFSVSWTSQPSNGTYTLVARATDTFGNATDSSTTTVLVNNTAAVGTGSSTGGAAVTSLSWSHTVGSEGNRILVVGATAERGSSACQAASVTYGGQALTKVAQATAGTSTYECASLWYLVAPASGTATITVSFSATVDATAGAVNLSNVKQGAPDASNSSSANSGATSTSVSTVAAQSIVVDVFGSGQALGDLAPGAGQTARWTQNSGASTSGGGSTKTVASAGSTSLTWTQTGINRSAQVVAAFAPLTPCNGGALTLAAPASLGFPAITLNGSNQTASAALALTVDDSTGSGAGWHVTGTSTTLTSAASRTLATTATQVVSASASAASGNCSLPTNGVAYPVTLPAASTPPAAAKLFSAGVSTGSGPSTVNLTLGVAVPANAYSGTYTSTWTIALVSGP